jgi:hypothetical protein
MITKINHFKSFLFILLTTLSFNAYSENSLNFGDYVVHFNAFRSDNLTPEVAKAYQLTRRNNRMIVNITVQKRAADGTTTPAKARVTGFASNLTGQVKTLNFKEVYDGDAIYYLAEDQVAHEEMLKFEIKVSPEGANVTGNVKFKQQFFTD